MRKVCTGMTAVGTMVYVGSSFLFTKVSWAYISFGVGMALFIIGMLGNLFIPKKISKRFNKKANAIIVNVSQTNVMLNELPVLEITLTFQTEDGQAITTSIRESVDYVTIPSLVPGVGLSILYDENEPKDVVLGSDDQGEDLNRTQKGAAVVKEFTVQQNLPNELIRASVLLEFKTVYGQSTRALITDIMPKDTSWKPKERELPVVLPIIYDPNNPDNVVVNLGFDPESDPETLEMMQDVRDKQRIKDGTLDEEMYNITRNGIKAEGILLSSAATGNIKNGRSELTMRIKVLPPSGESYEIEVIKFMDPISIKKMYIGGELIVYYMPDKPNNVALGVY